MKQYLITAGMALACLVAQAQVTIGLHGGPLFGTVALDGDVPEEEFLEAEIRLATAFELSAPIVFGVSERFGIQSGVGLLRRPFRQVLDFDGAGFTETFEAKVLYTALEVPLLARVTFVPDGPVSLAGYLGPSFQYLTAAKVAFSTGSGGGTQTIKLDFDSEDAEAIRRGNVFAVGGLQLAVPFAETGLAATADLRYRHQVDDTDDRDEATERSRLLAVLLGLTYRL